MTGVEVGEVLRSVRAVMDLPAGSTLTDYVGRNHHTYGTESAYADVIFPVTVKSLPSPWELFKFLPGDLMTHETRATHLVRGEAQGVTDLWSGIDQTFYPITWDDDVVRNLLNGNSDSTTVGGYRLIRGGKEITP